MPGGLGGEGEKSQKNELEMQRETRETTYELPT